MRAIKWITMVLLVVTTAAYVGTGIWQGLSSSHDGPELHCSGETLLVSVHAGEEELLQGVTASDDQDGDLTGRIILGGVSKLLTEDRAKVTYLVFDSDGNQASLERTIRYTDYRRPAIQLRTPLVYPQVKGVELLERLEAVDIVDGDITDKIRISTLWKTDRADVYSVSVLVTNSLGDTFSADLPVIIRPEETQGVKLRRQLFYMDRGQEFDPADHVDGSIQGLEIRNEVDTQVPGSYWVWYIKPGGEEFSILTVIVE